MGRNIVDVAVVIPDASPVLMFARIGRVDLLGSFAEPIKIVDQVFYEITKAENDRDGEAASGLQRLHNQIDVVETNADVGFKTRRAKNPAEPSGNLGEIAIGEYATMLARTNRAASPSPGHRWGDQHDPKDTDDSIRKSRADEKDTVRVIASELRTMSDDLDGCSLADVLEKLEKGKLGHHAAMTWLNIESQNDLVEIMHVNGRLMPGHQPMRVSPETQALVRSISRPLPAPKDSA